MNKPQRAIRNTGPPDYRYKAMIVKKLFTVEEIYVPCLIYVAFL